MVNRLWHRNRRSGFGYCLGNVIRHWLRHVLLKRGLWNRIRYWLRHVRFRPWLGDILRYWFRGRLGRGGYICHRLGALLFSLHWLGVGLSGSPVLVVKRPTH